MNDIMALAAHDLRSPLYTMKGLFDVLEGKTAWQKKPYSEVLQLLQDNCSGQLDLLNSLLYSYRIEHKQYDQSRERLDLIEIIKETRPKFENSKISIELRIKESAAPTISNPNAIRQILENLLSNATKFSSPESVIEVSLSRITEYWMIEVADEGPGIPENERERLFHKFFRASSVTPKQQGAGLGLFIVSQLTENLGGKISYKDRQPQGSIFSLSIPVK
jgi:signal transduction histidine kinase